MKIFKKDAETLLNGSHRVLNGVLLEFKARSFKEVHREDRQLFLNMIKRRMPDKRGGHLARDKSKLEDYGYQLPGERKKIGIEKEVASIVRVE